VSRVQHVIVGTAGHIDHGKTSLVRQLTGIDTDRLPEEKRRGISIDLGFAHWEADEFQFGLVDVPGHERFIKNMVAGVTGIDLCLLVVAADDGVMPQTREHLEIMDLLGVRTGLTVITKIDLVAPEYVELVRDEISELTAETFLAGCPILPVSCVTGAGIPELKAAIKDLAGHFAWPAPRELFRMPIDRVFTVPGHGTVVTGTVMGGSVHKGDIVELWPAGQATGQKIRIRGVQNHGADNELSGARQRTAINLAGVKLQDVSRGDELAMPGFTRPSNRILVRLHALHTSPIVLKDRLLLQLHLGTRECPARISLKGAQLLPGDKGYAELRLPDPVVAEYGQRFILRRRSPMRTIAGGAILDPFVEPRRRIKDLEAYGIARDTTDNRERLSQFLAEGGVVDSSPLEAAWRCGISTSQYPDLVQTLVKQGELRRISSGGSAMLVHRRRIEKLTAAVLRRVAAEIERHQPRRTMPAGDLRTACGSIARADLLDAILSQLIESGKLVRIGANLGLAEGRAQLTRQQAGTLAQILETIANAGRSPPTLKELANQLQQKPGQIDELLRLGVEDGMLIRVADGLFLSVAAVDDTRARCCRLIKQTGGATVSQLAAAWEVSRKYAVPLAEYFDSEQVTVRKGDLRHAGPNFDKGASGQAAP
jgi:selenocysteine-specific elongation factor